MSGESRLRLAVTAAAGPAAPPDGDAPLVHALARGSVEALARAFDRWHQRVRVLARRLLWDEAAAEDVVQEVFTSLPRAAARFRGDSDLETFLLGIALKRARHHVRAATRRRRALQRLADQPAGGTASGGVAFDPERDAYRRQLAGRMSVALGALPLAQREAFVLCEIEGLTSVQAARVARAPEATLRTRLFHARRRLRLLLVAEHGE